MTVLNYRTLDVGSGANKRAAIGVDLGVQRQTVDIRASAEYLPFRSRIFESSLSSHVLEHVMNPRQMISEMQRVTDGRITLEFPKPEYADILKYSVYEYLMNLPFSLLNPQVVARFLRQLYRIAAKKPSTYHRWIIYPELLGAATVMEDQARVLQPLAFLTMGRKARYFQALKSKRKILGLRVTLEQNKA